VSFAHFDRRAMARALELAARGMETAHPNPRVGCVIARGEQILAEGWHERTGGPHAEVVALRALAASAGENAAVGSTVYVTLEPCSHYGRTPPCVDALVAAQVARVIVAIPDPNPLVAGRGLAVLERAGITVVTGLMAAEAEELNVGYLKRMRTGRPFVRVKLGMSLDGRTALANGASKWITGSEAREDVQHWRARSSAVLTGVGTVLADDPQLNVRLPGAMKQPLRVVVDSKLRTPPDARVLDGSAPSVVFAEAAALAERSASTWGANGARLEPCAGERSEDGAAGARLALDRILERLGELEVNELLVEAGPTLSGAFVHQGFADELLIYIAPRLLGPAARPLLSLPLLEDLQQARQFRIIEQHAVGNDLRLRLRPV
jgi:diaminohydroxyphosphoribosylaminopyrimidine deaminase/5-amino-6-(5-phosphoribosylamino)uracil reductase